MKTITRIIKEKKGAGRLGRHVEHDPQSRAFSAGTAAIKTVTYQRHGSAFDQGDLGSCTGNAMAGVLMTDPFWVRGRNLTEADAVALYKAATKLDDIPGKSPPDDTGSSGDHVESRATFIDAVIDEHLAFGEPFSRGAHVPVEERLRVGE